MTRNYNKALAQRRALFAKAEPELEQFRRMAPQSQICGHPCSTEYILNSTEVTNLPKLKSCSRNSD